MSTGPPRTCPPCSESSSPGSSITTSPNDTSPTFSVSSVVQPWKPTSTLPKLRTAFPSGHLTTGIAYAFPAHRDTWYSAPRQQINLWLPIYPVRVDNAMAFFLDQFTKAVPNDSATFDYYQANRDRLSRRTRHERPEVAAVGDRVRPQR